MGKKQILIIGAVAVAAIIGFYVYLGGLNEVKVSVEQVSDYHLVGKPFKGKANDPFIEGAFFEARQYLESQKLNGILTIVHYKDTTLNNKEIKLFIGVKLNKGIADLPEGYQRLTIPAQRAIRATIEAHNVVMPKPSSIESDIKEKAQILDLKMASVTIEQYLSERELLVDIPIY